MKKGGLHPPFFMVERSYSIRRKNLTIQKTFDIDPNTTITNLIDFLSQHSATLISINPQQSLPLPSITISFPKSQLKNIQKILN